MSTEACQVALGYIEGLGLWPSDELDEVDRSDKRTPLRHMSLPQAVLDSKSKDQDDKDGTRHLKRRQMRKDLHRLKRCMARTGAAAMAASMFAGPGDGVTSMDLESRFRKQKRPPIPELFPELFNEVERDYGTVIGGRTKVLSDLTSGIKEVAHVRSYRDSVLDEGELSTEPVDWDKLSEMDPEEGGESKVDTVGVSGSDIWCDLDIKSEVDSQFPYERYSEDVDMTTINDENCAISDKLMHRKLRNLYHRSCAIEDSSKDEQLDFINVTCLDSVSRFRRTQRHSRSTRHHVSKSVAFGHVAGMGAPGFYESDGAVPSVADEQGAKEEEDTSTSPLSSSAQISRLGSAVSGLVATAHGATTRAVAQCRAGISALPGMLGAAPQHDIGDFTSPRAVWSAAKRALGSNAEERRAAQIFLGCTLCFLIVLTLSCAVLSLVIVAFIPTEFLMEAKDHPNETGMLDVHGRPKSISRVLTVVMISLFAGNGLAISHPMRDALLCGI